MRRVVREAGCEWDAHEHVVVLVTHEALKSSDLSTYRHGWHCIIDEVPTVWTHAEVVSSALHVYLKAAYTLEPLAGTDWSRLRVKADSPLLTDIYADSALTEWAELHRQIRDRGAIAKIKSWEEAASRSTWSLVSVWNPAPLSTFSSVILLGNAFEHTVTYKLFERTFGSVIKLQPFTVPTKREARRHPRKLLIRYFAESHRAGASFWDTANGHECLRRIHAWVNAHTEADQHYWSSNNARFRNDLTMVGQRVSPRIAGENGLRHLTCATFIYSAKPSRNEQVAFEHFGISYEEVVRSRELEDLIQMMWRSSLRDPEDIRPVEFRVYDRQQAEFLLEFMTKAAPHISVTLEQIDLGIDAFQPRKTGRPKKVLTAAEATARHEREKRLAAERQRKHREKLRADRGLDDQANDEGSLPSIDPSPSVAPPSGPSATPPSF